MKAFLLVAALFLIVWAVPVCAQDSKSPHFRRFDIGWNLVSYARQFDRDWGGGGASFVVRKSERLGFVADVVIHQTGLLTTARTHTYRFGPRFYAREKGRLTPFAEILAGGTSASSSTTRFLPGGGTTTQSLTGFALAAGGGVDMRIKPWFAWRIIQADYSLLRLAGNTSNGVRLDTGIVFRFGH